MTERALTLMELIVVVIIIGILAALSLPQFSKTKEHAIGKETMANLKLIAAAEKIYRMEVNAYYPIPAGTRSNIAGIDCATDGNINDCLRLSMPSGATRNWDYSITSTGSPPSSFTAYGDRPGSGGYLECQYSINQSQDGPVVASGAGTCP